MEITYTHLSMSGYGPSKLAGRIIWGGPIERTAKVESFKEKERDVTIM